MRSHRKERIPSAARGALPLLQRLVGAIFSSLVSTSDAVCRGCLCWVAVDAVWHEARSNEHDNRRRTLFMPLIRTPAPGWALNRRFRRMFLASATAFAAAGCSSLSVEQFAQQSPPFDPIAYFTGKTHSWGVFENRAGDPSRRFQTACIGRMENGVLFLDQTFTYDDGHQQQRHWHIRRVDAHRYEATANDVVGTGSGTAFGNAFRWEYTVALKPGNPFLNVHLRQWMYLQAGGRTLLNRGTVRVLGAEVAQITEQFRRE